MERVILHSDMNNFYASAKCMLDPKLKRHRHHVAVFEPTQKRHGIKLQDKILYLNSLSILVHNTKYLYPPSAHF